MISALSSEEASFYSAECNWLEPGKRLTLFREIEHHYGFVGARLVQYRDYFHRRDTRPLWEWAHSSDVKLVSGFT